MKFENENEEKPFLESKSISKANILLSQRKMNLKLIELHFPGILYNGSQ